MWQTVIFQHCLEMTTSNKEFILSNVFSSLVGIAMVFASAFNRKMKVVINTNNSIIFTFILRELCVCIIFS